jgi:hypothetical protein
MFRTVCAAVSVVAATLSLLGSAACAQPYAPADAGAFVDFSLKALLEIVSSNPRDRTGARNLLARQITGFNPPTRAAAADTLFARLRSDASQAWNDAYAVLGLMPSPWTTNNLDSDVQLLYQRLQSTPDDVSRDLVDNALANARGLYKDGIASFNSTHLPDLVASEPKLRTMSLSYPLSRYGERAAFYFAQLYAKRFVLGDAAGTSLLQSSNMAFEDYIKRAEKGEFNKKTDYLAAGYYYRALNGWLANDINDSQAWLNKGQKFQGTESVYIYQLFVSRDKETVIDKYVPAKVAFEKTQAFISRVPTPLPSQAGELLAALRQSN